MPAPRRPARLIDNPTGDAFNNLQDDGRRFEVLHTSVGTVLAGSVVSAREFGPGATMQRLIDLGAIRELTPEEIALREPADGGLTGEAVDAQRFDPQFNTGNPHDEPIGSGPAPETAKPVAAAAAPKTEVPAPTATKK
jgi:hypothetical protein